MEPEASVEGALEEGKSPKKPLDNYLDRFIDTKSLLRQVRDSTHIT